MHDNSNNYLQILSQLAKEYQQKYAELEQVCQEAQPDSVLQQLTARAELTTDHFRAAQQALFASLEQNQQQQNEYITQAATTISRCFDEMRILFSVLLVSTCNLEKQK